MVFATKAGINVFFRENGNSSNYCTFFRILASPPVMIWGPCNNTVIGLVIGQVKFGFWFGGIEIFLSSQIII